MTESSKDDKRWMESALREAEKALERKEVPIGAVVVRGGKIIGRGYNQIESLKDPTAHAEIIAITAAAMHIGDRRLHECVLYVTLEPCVMCAGAIVMARIPRLVYATSDPKAGACQSLYKITEDPRLNHRVSVSTGVMQEECGALLKGFFVQVRNGEMEKPGRGKNGKI